MKEEKKMKENELKETLIEEETKEEKVDESKIVELINFAPIITSIVIVPQTFKTFTSYIAKITVKNVGDLKVRVDENLVMFVKTCQKLGKQAFISKTVVKEMNEEKQKNYVCLKFVTTKNNVFRYFIGRADVETLELAFDDYNEKMKK